jgi:hypothetical protein
MDNGWDSVESVFNIKQIISKLGFDYDSYVLNWEEFKDLQLSFLKAMVPEIETPTDHAILGALHRMAERYDVKYIISAGNYINEGMLPKSWHYDAKDIKYIKGIHKRFGTQDLNTFPTFGYKDEIYYKFVKGIKIVYILNYVFYTPKESKKIFEQELGCRDYKVKHGESFYTRFVQSYILPIKFNIDYRKLTLSMNICRGEITREEALKELTKLPYDPETIEKDKKYVAKKLGITIEEFEEILKLPPKTYKDYHNDEKKLRIVYGLYRTYRWLMPRVVEFVSS